MNTARKVIISIFAPILVGIPILSFEWKANYSESEFGSSWNPMPLYEFPMAWWGVAFLSAVFLMVLWRDSKA
ncbi:hypothetical protein HAHE_29660 [Haloferula helveola]|uniref:DUF3311 domain-containing protein n=1 Tax=Haloferula helveola TaxID=490095 RepID=A0ABM7RGT1_9BACT|nr:hypothetical protein HAHE_29660 [Haloferula helveola]